MKNKPKKCHPTNYYIVTVAQLYRGLESQLNKNGMQDNNFPFLQNHIQFEYHEEQFNKVLKICTIRK